MIRAKAERGTEWWVRSATKAALVGTLVLAAVSCGTSTSSAGDYPNSSISYVVPFEAGGTTDLLGRQVGTALSEAMDTKVSFDNVAGAGGALGTERAVTAKADGYTVGMAAVTTMTVAPLQNPDLSYQSTDDYTIFGRLPLQPMVLVVREDAPWDTMGEFIQDAGKNPGTVSIAHSGTYTTPGLASYAMERAADVKFNIVPYAGGGSDARNAVLAGDADATIAGGPLFEGFVKSGQMKVIGVFFDGGYPLYPDAPSAFDEGVEWEAVSEFLLLGPPRIPEDVASKISENLKAAVTSSDFEAKAKELGFISDYADPEETSKLVQQAQGEMAELVDYVETRQ